MSFHVPDVFGYELSVLSVSFCSSKCVVWHESSYVHYAVARLMPDNTLGTTERQEEDRQLIPKNIGYMKRHAATTPSPP